MSYNQFKTFMERMAMARTIESQQERLSAIRAAVAHRPQCAMSKQMEYLRRYQREKRNPFHVYMITFTTDPKRIPKQTEDLDQRAQKYLKSRCQTKELMKADPKTWLYSVEKHKSGRLHYHALLETSKSCPRSVFRDWARKFGNYDYSESKTRDVSHTINYITKETVPTVIKARDKIREYLDPSLIGTTSEDSENA